MKRMFRVVAACGVLGLMPGLIAAQTVPGGPRLAAPAALDPNGTWTLPKREQVNDGTVTVLSAPVGGVTSILASDLARVLDSDDVRVLQVVGKGPVQNVIDILYLKTIDMGAVVSDVPEFFRLQYNIPDISTRLRYISKWYNNEIHIIAPTSIRTVFDLAGKKIMAPKDVGYYSAKVIFSRLNIKATFDVETDDNLGLQKVVDGEADAWFVSTGKVMPTARNLRNDSGRLHLVSIPYDPRLQDVYVPSVLTSDDYPNLIPPGQQTDTLGSNVLLAVYNWPENTERYNRVANFVEAFFSHIDQFYKPPRHPKWQEASISAVVPGWQRFKAAQDWLDRHQGAAPPPASGVASSDDFKQFLSQSGIAGRANLSDADMQRLFNEFLEWKRTRR